MNLCKNLCRADFLGKKEVEYKIKVSVILPYSFIANDLLICQGLAQV